VYNASHSHPFEVRALMLSGELQLTFEGRTQVCKAGDIFTMRAGCEHEERFGPAGATYLAGRKQPAA
jgi:quercetin dioxygenase-like cupin family protein